MNLRALVLRTVKYGESKLIVDVFSRSGGRMSFVASVPKSGRGKFRKQFFQPLCMIDCVCDVRPKAGLHKLCEVSMHSFYSSLPYDERKLSVGLFVAEFLCHALRGEQRNENLFDYIADSLLWLDGSGGGFVNFHLVFMLRISRFLGFYPNTDDYAEGDFFDLRSACFCRTEPFHRDFLPPGEARSIRLMMRISYATMRLLRLSRAERNRMVDVVLRYYSLHIPDFPEMKSLAVLREMAG